MNKVSGFKVGSDSRRTYVMPPPRAYQQRPRAWKALPGSNPQSLLSRPAEGCCWPVDGGVDEHLFCSERRTGHATYCDHHRKLSVSSAAQLIKPAAVRRA